MVTLLRRYDDVVWALCQVPLCGGVALGPSLVIPGRPAEPR